jgi:putative nucleotidyltransferase with HDIG domain
MGHILIVEDEESIRDVLAQHLAMEGHSCDSAENADAGIRKVQEREFDVIISDINMPGMNGIEFLRRIRPFVEFRTPCMILTAYDEWRYAMEAIRVGACNYLLKNPFDLNEVATAVDRALDLRKVYQFRHNYEKELERKLKEKEQELKRTYDGTVIGFAAMMEGKDSSTMAHLFRVRDYCTLLAREVGIPESRMRDVQLGAMLHDIGKYRVPDEILTKPGPLTEEEWKVMRRHPEFGADFVKRIPFLAGASEIIQNHHEKFDGGGYPRGLAGEEIPVAARVFMVVDAYDAIVSERCYKPKQSSATAIAEIRRCSGAHFDPHVVDAFERILPKIEACADGLEEQHRREVAEAGLGLLPDRSAIRRETATERRDRIAAQLPQEP